MSNTKFNTFSEVKVGETIYWSSLDCEHIHSTIVTGITLTLDGEHIPEFCDVKFSTNDSIEFSMCKHLTKIHNCIVFSWKSDSNIIYAEKYEGELKSFMLPDKGYFYNETNK